MADFNDFKTKYPELVAPADANQSAIEAQLLEAAVVVNLGHCPRYSDYLQLSYAAHTIAISGNNPEGADTASGPASSESVGSVSISYQIAESSGKLSDFFRTTSYGRDHLRFVRMCFGSGVMTT